MPYRLTTIADSSLFNEFTFQIGFIYKMFLWLLYTPCLSYDFDNGVLISVPTCSSDICMMLHIHGPPLWCEGLVSNHVRPSTTIEAKERRYYDVIGEYTVHEVDGFTLGHEV